MEKQRRSFILFLRTPHCRCYVVTYRFWSQLLPPNMRWRSKGRSPYTHPLSVYSVVVTCCFWSQLLPPNMRYRCCVGDGAFFFLFLFSPFQETDTHWRAKGGKGSFNWRMKFPVMLGPRARSSKFPYLTLQARKKRKKTQIDILVTLFRKIPPPGARSYPTTCLCGKICFARIFSSIGAVCTPRSSSQSSSHGPTAVGICGCSCYKTSVCPRPKRTQDVRFRRTSRLLVMVITPVLAASRHVTSSSNWRYQFQSNLTEVCTLKLIQSRCLVRVIALRARHLPRRRV